MPITKLTALEREATRLAGERGQLQASIAQVKGKISETELQIVQIDRDLSGEVGKELELEGELLGDVDEGGVDSVYGGAAHEADDVHGGFGVEGFGGGGVWGWMWVRANRAAPIDPAQFPHSARKSWTVPREGALTRSWISWRAAGKKY